MFESRAHEAYGFEKLKKDQNDESKEEAAEDTMWQMRRWRMILQFHWSLM